MRMWQGGIRPPPPKYQAVQMEEQSILHSSCNSDDEIELRHCASTLSVDDGWATLLPWPVGFCINRGLEIQVILGPSQRVPTRRTAPLGIRTVSMDRVLELVGSFGGGLRSTALIWRIWAESSRPILTSQRNTTLMCWEGTHSLRRPKRCSSSGDDSKADHQVFISNTYFSIPISTIRVI